MRRSLGLHPVPVLANKTQVLKPAGLQRVTVSLGSLDDARFWTMNDVGFPLGKVAPHSNGEVSSGWRYRDGGREIGVIFSVAQCRTALTATPTGQA